MVKNWKQVANELGKDVKNGILHVREKSFYISRFILFIDTKLPTSMHKFISNLIHKLLSINVI